MISLDRARMVADYLRAQAELRRASLGTLAALLVVTVFAARMPESASWISHAALISGLLIGPWLLRTLSPKGNLAVYRLELAAFPLNALLLGLIVFMEASRLPRIEIEGVPAMRWFFPALSLLVPFGYLLLGFADWLRRLRLAGWIRGILAVPPVDAYLEGPEELIEAALAAAPGTNDSWAQFRTVPASAKNAKLFFKLDTARHGFWRVAFADDYALVVFHDGTGCEAVAPGGVSLAVDDAPRPGERERMILVRWNGHFHEGRILRDDLLKIQAWNSRSGGFEGGSSVPAPGF
ncbi:MAG TPA: hypothetical protein VNV60_10515 [Holophagaceae bacterium]|jgi:hypothetical protein|nr:hypothetical protein [Holophagaceae bacterium]